MKISEFFISGFGIFSNIHRDGLSGGLNVFVGDNEAGKSTLLAFFRAIFFGFETGTSRENPYKPVGNSEHGGLIKLQTERDGETYTIKRSPGKTRGAVEVTFPDGRTAGDEALSQLLPGATRDLHRNVFAFSLDELQDLKSLDERDIKSRIYSCGAGAGRVSAIDVEKKLDTEMKDLFGPTARLAVINALFTKVDAAQASIKDLSAVSADYDRLRADLNELKEKIETAQAASEALQSEITRLDHVERCRERITEVTRKLEVKQVEREAEEQKQPEGQPTLDGKPVVPVKLFALVVGACLIALSVALRSDLAPAVGLGLLGLIVAAAGLRIQAGLDASEKARRADILDRVQRHHDDILDRISREIGALDLELRQARGEMDGLLWAGIPASTDTASIQRERELKRDSHNRMNAELADLRVQEGRLTQQIEHMEQSDKLSTALLQERTLQAQLDKHASEWASKSICKALLRRTRERYEREKQPRVIQAASRFLSEITSGAYARVLSPLGREEVELETPEGLRKDVSKLSRGTREQLYLALRFGLILEYGQNAEPLPVIMDDILVNFDPARSRAAARAILELNESNQVLFFTCHPWIADMFAELDASVSRFDVRDGGITAV